jgi:hypothetical protein
MRKATTMTTATETGWRAVHHRYGLYRVLSGDRKVLADHIGDHDEGTGRDRAKLFAAAPQLLEACERAEEFCEDNVCGAYPRAAEIAALLRAAIAATK